MPNKNFKQNVTMSKIYDFIKTNIKYFQKTLDELDDPPCRIYEDDMDVLNSPGGCLTIREVSIMKNDDELTLRFYLEKDTSQCTEGGRGNRYHMYDLFKVTFDPYNLTLLEDPKYDTPQVLDLLSRVISGKGMHRL